MKKNNKTKANTEVETNEETTAEAIPAHPLPTPFPLPKPPVSGLYTRSLLIPMPLPVPIPIPTPIPGPPPVSFEEEAEFGEEETGQALSNIIPPFGLPREELRVDVDGLYPQKLVSGTIFNGLVERVHWIANVAKTGANRWEGAIWYKNGVAAAMPYTQIKVEITNSFLPSLRSAKVTYSGGGLANSVRTYKFASPYFHPVEFEYDCATSVLAQTSINTCDHPNRPPTLACETLTIERVFQRAGFEVKKGVDNIVPLAGAGPNAKWSDNEMHDAMQIYWSKFAAKSQWAMWVFFAALHEMGTGLGGIMFDDIGPNHRQGTAIFNDSFISQPPAGETSPAAWVRRMKFWTACHEMGHAFNLAHSWQKNLGTPWIPLANESEARSFMNYPYGVAGGQTAFFSNFMFRFSDNELKFLRHAPARFVQQGNADWFDHHGFQQAAISPEPTFKLEVRANRAKPIFEFLEPVVLELKLTNISNQPQIVEDRILSASEQLTVIIKKQGRQARQWSPFAQYCFNPNKVVLNANESKYESLFLAVGTNGWDLAEPGNYSVQVALHLENEDIVSAPAYVRIAPPTGFQEEYFAQDFFSEDVGRALAFDGTRALEGANETLKEAIDRFPKRRVAIHAQVALGSPLTHDYKLLSVPAEGIEATAVWDVNGRIVCKDAKPETAAKQISEALFENSNEAAETLGHVDYKYYVDQLSETVAEDNAKTAAKYQGDLYDTLSSRGVLDRVLEEIDDRKNLYDPSRVKAAARK
jgi:hypothetical protein